MRRQEIACCACAFVLWAGAAPARAAEDFTVVTFVPTFAGPTNLGASVSTILALRLWTTLRPRPNPNPDNLFFGTGKIEWSKRTIETRQAAIESARKTQSEMALWGTVGEYGPGVIVASNLVIAPSAPAAIARQTWPVKVGSVSLQLGLPSISYRFSTLLLSKDVVEKYSRPNQVRVCEKKVAECAGRLLGDSFRGVRKEDDFIFVRQSSLAVGWVPIPDLSAGQSEVVGFTAALISYMRGDFEQAEAYFSQVRDGRPVVDQDTRDYKADSLVRNDAALLAGISKFRRKREIDGLRAAHAQNPYSRYAVQALVMADLDVAASLPAGDAKASHVKEASELVESYRHLFPPDDPWLNGADRALRNLN
jgi:hypothetical protein